MPIFTSPEMTPLEVQNWEYTRGFDNKLDELLNAINAFKISVEGNNQTIVNMINGVTNYTDGNIASIDGIIENDGILKSNGEIVSVAVPEVDYELPLSFIGPIIKSASREISITRSSVSISGYIHKDDFTLFNNKYNGLPDQTGKTGKVLTSNGSVGSETWETQAVGVIPNAPIIGDTKTKITYDTKGLVTSGDNATTADIADSTDARYCTDAQKTVIGNTSGTNSGDETTATLGAKIQGATAKSTPDDDDVVGFSDVHAANILKSLTWTNIKAFLKSYFDTVYTLGNLGGESVLTISTGLTRSVNTITNDIATGKSGGQAIYGSTLTGEDLNIRSNVVDLDTGSVNFLDTLDASSSTVAATTFAGGVGIAKNLNVDNGTLLVDATNNRVGVNVTPISKIEAADNTTGGSVRGFGLYQYGDTSTAGLLYVRKSRGTEASPTAVQNGDYIMSASPYCYDGANYQRAGFFGFKVNGTVAAGSTPCDFVLFTGANWAGETEKLRVKSTGEMGIGTTEPRKKFDINSSTGDCLCLVYNDSNGSPTYYVDLTVTSAGNLTLTPSGGKVAIGGATQAGYLNLPACTATVPSIVIETGGTPVSSPTPGMIWTNGNKLMYRVAGGWSIDLTLGYGSGTSGPFQDIAIDGEANRAIYMQRETSGAGKNLTESAGGCQAGASNSNGGTLYLNPGISTCRGYGQVVIGRTIRSAGGVSASTLNAGGNGYSIGDVFTIVSPGGSGATGQVLTLSGSAVATYIMLTSGTGMVVANALTTTVAPAGGTGLKINVTAVTGTSDNTVCANIISFPSAQLTSGVDVNLFEVALPNSLDCGGFTFTATCTGKNSTDYAVVTGFGYGSYGNTGGTCTGTGSFTGNLQWQTSSAIAVNSVKCTGGTAKVTVSINVSCALTGVVMLIFPTIFNNSSNTITLL